MIVIKLLVLSLVFASCLYIGILVSKKYSGRVKELKDMKNALNMLETKIKYTYEALPEIFEEISKQITGEIGQIFRNSAKKMQVKSAGDAWNESIDFANTNMDIEDKAILKTLGKLLGKTDAEGQISEIKLVSNFLDTQIKVAEQERNKNEKMYKTLGGIVGLTIVIILI